MQPLKTIVRPSSGSVIGWAPAQERSMIFSRRCASATASCDQLPAPSGPRSAIVSAIRCTPPTPAAAPKATSPAIPHIVLRYAKPIGAGPAVAGRFDEGIEQRRLLGPRDERLGVPLDADHELAVHRLDRLDGSIRRAARDHEPAAEPGDALVMKRVDVGVGTFEHPGDPAGFPERDLMRRLGAR